MNIDRTALGVLIAYSVGFILNTITWINDLVYIDNLHQENIGFAIFSIFYFSSSILIWFIIYFAVFEMMLIKATI